MYKNDRIYNLIYYSIAAATFKHSAWAFSTVFEGSAPQVDLNTLTLDLVGVWAVLTLLIWYIWGGAMALAIDVGMLQTAKHIRDFHNEARKPWGLWLTYTILSVASGFTQIYYAAHHAAPLGVIADDITILQPGGWLYSILQYRVVLLPISLPGMALAYTLSAKLMQRSAKPEIGKLEIKTGEVILNAKQAAEYANYSEPAIRLKANKGQIGRKNPETGQWEFTKSELDEVKRTS